MKLHFFFLSVIVFFVTINLSQAQFNVAVNTGLGIPAGGVTSLEPYFVQIEPNGDRNVFASTLGAGVNYGISVGYQFNKSISTRIKGNFLSSFQGDIYQHVQLSGVDTKVTSVFKASAFSISPQIIVQDGHSERKAKLYAYFGPTFNLPSLDIDVTTEPEGGEIVVGVMKYRGGMNIGFAGGAGVDISISNRVTLFSEFEARILSWHPEKLTNLDGSITHFDKNPSATDPLSVDQQSVAFGSFGLNLGIKLQLSK